jgi:hypothetical protein
MARHGYRLFDSDTHGGPELPGYPTLTPTRSLSLTFLAMWPSARP